MTAPGDLVLLLVLLAVSGACCGYAAGRMHQRRRHGADRAQAYRDGYASGTRSVFGMAARVAGRPGGEPAARDGAPVRQAPITPDATPASGDQACPAVPGSGAPAGTRGRHAVPEEPACAATYRLPPDRVARARVPRPRRR